MKTIMKLDYIWSPIIVFILIIVIWQMFISIFDIQRWILPEPLLVFREMIVNYSEFAPHIMITFRTILIGFFVAVPLGIIIAAIITNYRLLDAALSPYIVFLVTIPLIILVPILMVWVGVGHGVILIGVIIQAFPIINLNSATAFLNVDTMRIELMQSLGATRLQTFSRAILPSSLPQVFTGMRLAGIFATIAAISGEYVAGSVGLGSQIIRHSQWLRTEAAFGSIFFVAILGIILYLAITLLERFIIKWKI